MSSDVVINKNDFIAYESLRRTGKVNMFNIKVVSEITGLTKEQILYIMKHYEELRDKYMPKTE